MSKLAKYLNEHIVGNVFDRPSICEAYAEDRSILRSIPKIVAFPETASDLAHLVRFSNQLSTHNFDLPITIRGAGLDKTGAAIGEGMLVSTSRMNRIEEIDVRGRLIRAQPGVTLGELNTALGLQGLSLPIVYNPQATIGGLIANCPTDDAYQQHGGIFHFVERVEAILSNGEIVQFAPYNARAIELKTAQDSFESSLYRKIQQILEQYGDTIVDRSMRPFDPSGYANITKVKDRHSLNLLPLLFASQGTLALVTDVILRIEVLPPLEQRLVVATREIGPMLKFLASIRELDPHTIRLFDLRIVEIAKRYGNYCKLLPDNLNTGWFAIIGFNNRPRRAQKKLQLCLQSLPAGTFATIEDRSNSLDFQEFTSALISFLNNDLNGERAAIADDVYIPKYKLEDYIKGLKLLEGALDTELLIHGSYLTSNYSVRPLIDYSAIDGRKKAINFLRQYSRLVADCEGSVTGGSPEGRVKALAPTQVFSPEEYRLYSEIKTAFDPNNIFNPKVKLGADIRDTIRHLRTSERNGIITP